MADNKLKDSIKTNKTIDKLLAIIKSNKGRITPVEAATVTGFSLEEITSGLNRLIELYEVRVNLNQENGRLQYIFKYPLFERGKKTFSEKLASFASTLYKGFKFIYKGSIGVVLIFYTIIFAIILMALASSSNNDDDNSIGFGNIFAVMLRAILESMHIVTYHKAVERIYDVDGNAYKAYKPEKNKGKNFIQSVFSFVFGPEQPKFDALADAKEVLAYIRLYTKGRLTTSNIIELAGGNFVNAESKLAEYVSKFKGELNISNNGILYGDFENMLDDVSIAERSNIEFYKDEVEPPVEFSGNTKGKNILIIIMNTFNLIMSLFLFNYLLAIGNQGLFIFLSVFPFIVSVLYFIIPLLRIPSYRIRKSRRKYKIMHKKLVGYICSQRKMIFNVNEFFYLFRVKSRREEDDLQTVLKNVVTELEGTIELLDGGEVVYKFERLYNELTIA